MAQRTALLLGGTKMVERHLRRALPADVDMIEMRTIEAAMRRLEDDSVAILVFGPTLRRSLALVTTLRSDPRTSRVPLVVVYRDDQRSDVDRHLDGRYKADAYVIQSRAQRELEQAIVAAMAAPRSDLGMPSEQLDALPLAAVSALTQDITQFAQAAAAGQPKVETTLELDAIDLVEEPGGDPSESATQMLDVLDFADIEEIEPQVDADALEPLEEIAVAEISAAPRSADADAVATLGDLDIVELELEELSDSGMRSAAAPQATTMAILPEELPLEELDAELLDVGEVEAMDVAMVDDEDLLDIEDLVVDNAEQAADDSILEDLGDIEELDEIEPFEASTQTDHETELGLADEIELLDEDLAALSAEPVEVEAVALGGSSRASDIAIEALDITEMEPEEAEAEADAADSIEAVEVEAVEVEAVEVEAVEVAELAPEPAAAPAPEPGAAPAAEAKAEVAAEVVVPPQRHRHASSTELLSSNLSELTTLITKLQAALSDIDRLEGENAELRAELEAKAGATGPAGAGAELEAVRAELAKAQAALQEAEQLGMEAMAASEAAQAQVAALQSAQAAAAAEAERERKALQAELAAARDTVAGHQASAAAAKELLRKAMEQL